MEGHGNFFVRVIYNFTASNPDELSGTEGDILKVKSQVNEHWYEGEINGKKGLFPVIYATKIEDPLQYDIFVAIETYHGIRPSELSFSRGERISVIEEVDENWWRGECHGKMGIFPNSYVETEKLYESICGDDHTSYQNGGLYGNQEMFSVVAKYDFEARNHEELSFPQGGIIIIIKDIDDDWYEGSFEGKTGLFPKSYVEHCSQDIYEVPPRAYARSIYPFVGESESELTFKEGEVIFLRKRAGSQWLEGEHDGNVGLFPASFVEVEIDLPPEEQKASETITDHSKTVQPQKILWREGNKARALYHFSALHTGDLALNEGDVVTVVKVEDDNWIEGRLDNGVSGMCPSAYLELADFTPNGRMQTGESSVYREIRGGVTVPASQKAHITSNTATHGSNGGRRHSETEMNFTNYSSRSRAERVKSVGDDRILKPSNKPKPAPRPPQTKSQTLGAESRMSSTRNLSKSNPFQPSSPPQQTNKASIYAIPFKSSHNKFSPVSFNPSKPKGSAAYAQKSSITNYGFDSQDGGRSSSSRGGEGGSGGSLLDMSVSNRASSLNLASPLLALPSNYSNQSDSGSEEYPIVPKRKAPLPPNRTSVNDYKSYSLPRNRTNPPENRTNMNKFSSERTQFGSSPNIAQTSSKTDSAGLRPAPRVDTAHKKRPPPPPARYNKDKITNITRSATISSSQLANYKQEREIKSENKKARPASVYYVGEDDDKVWNNHVVIE